MQKKNWTNLKGFLKILSLSKETKNRIMKKEPNITCIVELSVFSSALSRAIAHSCINNFGAVLIQKFMFMAIVFLATFVLCQVIFCIFHQKQVLDNAEKNHLDAVHVRYLPSIKNPEVVPCFTTPKIVVLEPNFLPKIADN